MLNTFTPSRRAIRAWPNSCSKTELNSNKVVSNPSPQLTVIGAVVA